jgi:hypothetical protein
MRWGVQSDRALNSWGFLKQLCRVAGGSFPLPFLGAAEGGIEKK